MAQDVHVPGDELREAQDMLGFVHDFIDIGHHTFDFDAAFGPELSRGSAQNFENRWNDGKQRLRKQVQGVRDAVGGILDSFEKTDQDAARSLDDGQGGPVSGAQRFVLDVPDLWDRIDLGGEQLAERRAAALATTDDPREKARINDMFRQGREVARAARRQGALLAAGTATLYAEGLFMAYGMVFAVTTPRGSELTLPVLSAQLGVSSANGAAPRDRVITSAEVPGVGTVARVTGTETTRLTGDVDLALLTMHTMMPVPGTAEDFLVVTLASPNLPLKAEVYDLFDAITGTFRFVRG